MSSLPAPLEWPATVFILHIGMCPSIFFFLDIKVHYYLLHRESSNSPREARNEEARNEEVPTIAL